MAHGLQRIKQALEELTLSENVYNKAAELGTAQRREIVNRNMRITIRSSELLLLFYKQAYACIGPQAATVHPVTFVEQALQNPETVATCKNKLKSDSAAYAALTEYATLHITPIPAELEQWSPEHVASQRIMFKDEREVLEAYLDEVDDPV
jgi:ribosome maturation protein Sdo1